MVDRGQWSLGLWRVAYGQWSTRVRSYLFFPSSFGLRHSAFGILRFRDHNRLLPVIAPNPALSNFRSSGFGPPNPCLRHPGRVYCLYRMGPARRTGWG